MFGKKFFIVVAAAFLLQAAWSGSTPLSAQQGTLHNCPQPGKSAISVWEGQNGIETSQALDTCGDQAVDFAWYLDPDTQAWMGYSVEYPGANDLLTLDNLQGIITHGKALPPPIPTPVPQVGIGKIAFTSESELSEYKEDLWVINPDGSGKTKIIEGVDSIYGVSLSPTGDTLAFRIFECCEPAEFDLLVFDLAGNQLARIHDVADMSRHPDGNSLIYTTHCGDMYEFDLRTRRSSLTIETMTAPECQDPTGFDQCPVWSPDGKKLVFSHGHWGLEFDVVIVNYDESKIPYVIREGIEDPVIGRVITPDTTTVLSTTQGINECQLYQWTPDSTKFVFSAGEDDSEDQTIYVVDVLTGSVQTIKPEGLTEYNVPEDVDLSNDGTKIAFIAGDADLYTVNVDGSDMRKLLGDGDSEITFRKHPRWSPDDSQIVFALEDLWERHFSIQVINADGTGLRDIPNTSNPPIAWRQIDW